MGDEEGRRVTSWTAEPGRGAHRLLQNWIRVVSRPHRFFRTGVVPGEQGAGLVFAMAVVAVEEATRLALAPETIPTVVGGRVVSAGLVVGVATLLVAPAGLHLVAALQTLLLRPLVADRAGVSSTVQVLAYAAAPCALVGPPVPAIRVLCAVYGTWLLVVGIETVHDTTRRRAAIASAIPAGLVFGYGFRGFAALADQLAAWYII